MESREGKGNFINSDKEKNVTFDTGGRDILDFLDNLKVYKIPEVNHSNHSKPNLTASEVFHQIQKSGLNLHKGFCTSQYNKLNKHGIEDPIETFDAHIENGSNIGYVFSTVLRNSSNYGDLCYQIYENGLFPYIQRLCYDCLVIILNNVASRRFEILQRIPDWNNLYNIQSHYHAMSDLMSEMHDKQFEKGWSKLYHRRYKQRPCRQSSKRKLQAIKIPETKKFDVDLQLKTATTPVELRHVIGQPGHVIPLPANVYPFRNPLDNPSRRLYTFTDWPLKTQFWPQQLANAGFYYTSEGTTVKCVTCGVSSSVENWSRQDRPERVHYNLNNDCEFIKGNFPHLINKPDYQSVINDVPSRNGSHVEDGIGDDQPVFNGLNEPEIKYNTHGMVHGKETSQHQKGQTESESSGYASAQSYVNGNGIQPTQIKSDTAKNVLTDNADLHVHKQSELTKDILRTNSNEFSRDINEPLSRATNIDQPSDDSTFQDHVQGYRNQNTNRIQSPTEYTEYTVNTPVQHMKIPSSKYMVSLDNQIPLLNGYKSSVDIDQPPSGITNQSMEQGSTYEPDFPFPEFRNFRDRIDTFSNWPANSAQHPNILAETGCFYTGEADIVRCFCCNLGLAEWAATDDPWVEHARHNPKCWFLRKHKGQTFIDRVQDEWRKRYKPKNPAFDDLVSRLATFEGWRDDIEQTPELLAEAGFFFTGEDDILRCHYCDGGLRNWEQGDEPWEEHARWFPNCKFLIKMKGSQYINSIKEKYQDANASGQEEQETSRLLSTEAARTLLNMEIPVSAVKLAINNFIKRKGHMGFQVDDLLNLVFESKSRTPNSPSASAALAAHNRPLPAEKDPAHLKEINAELKKNLLCVICNKNARCMLFVNCGHRLTCEQCCRSIDFCPHCDKKIKKIIKTYLS